MGAEVLVEKVVLDHFAEGWVIVDPLVEVEVQVDDLLDDLVDLVVEGYAHVLERVDLGGCVERSVLFEPLHHSAERYAVFVSELDAEALIELDDDA